jgi:mitogen-activated protein kinase 3
MSAADAAEQAKIREARQTQMQFAVPNSFRCLRIVGKGAYGMVCEAIDKKAAKGKERVAIKKIKEALFHPLDAKLVLRELKISRLIGKHPNILGIRDLIRPNSKRRMDTIYIVSDFMDTDLYRLCQSQVEFTENHVRHLMYQMLCGLNYMHSANILHRDMKTANLLVDRNFNLQICDFGLARFAAPGHDYDCEGSTGSVPDTDGPPPLTELVVTLWYRAPELVANSHYNSAIDMWAVGCIFAEMLLRRPIFPGRDHLHQLQLITEVMGTPSESDIRTIRGAYARRVLRSLPYRPPKPWRSVFPDASSSAIDLIKNLLQFDASKRLTAEEALNHPYLRDLRTPVADMVVPRALSSEFEFDQLTSPKIMPMKQMIYDEIMLYHDPSSQIAQDRGRGKPKSTFGRFGSREMSKSPPTIPSNPLARGRTSSHAGGGSSHSRSRSSSSRRNGRESFMRRNAPEDTASKESIRSHASSASSPNYHHIKESEQKPDSSKAVKVNCVASHVVEEDDMVQMGEKGAVAAQNNEVQLPTRVATAPAGSNRQKRPSSAARGRSRPVTASGVVENAGSTRNASNENGDDKGLAEYLAKEKAFLAREREDLERQTKLVDKFEQMRLEREKSRSPSKQARLRRKAGVAKQKKAEAPANPVRTAGFRSPEKKVRKHTPLTPPPPLPTPEMRMGSPEKAILSTHAVLRPDEELPPRPPSRDSLRPSSRGSDRPPSAGGMGLFQPLAFEPPRLPSRDSSRGGTPVSKEPTNMEDKPEVASPVLPRTASTAYPAEVPATARSKEKAASPGSAEAPDMEEKKSSPAGGGLAAIKAVRRGASPTLDAASTPSCTKEKTTCGKKKRSPAGTGLEAVKAVREEAAAAAAASSRDGGTVSPVPVPVHLHERTQSFAKSKGRPSTVSGVLHNKAIDVLEAMEVPEKSSTNGFLREQHTKTISDAAKALDAALSGLGEVQNPVTASKGSSGKAPTDISNKSAVLGKTKSNCVLSSVSKKPIRSTSSADVTVFGQKRAKENKPWVFKPTELARARRKRLAEEARQRANEEGANATIPVDEDTTSVGMGLLRMKKKAATVPKPFNFATAGRFSGSKQRKDREMALQRKHEIAGKLRANLRSTTNLSNTGEKSSVFSKRAHRTTGFHRL